MSEFGSARQPGLAAALRRLRDPLLLLAAPATFALLVAFVGYAASWPIGFDFRGTLWEPARALLDGAPIYPEPTRDAVLIGNPAVYPPLFILVVTPLALLPVTAAAWVWLFCLGVGVFAAMWILGVRDWRCHVLALTSPVVVHGLYYGNLTLLLVIPLAVAWRYRDRAQIAGIAVGAAVAAKLFVWPLVVWLLLTRRFRAAAWAIVSAVGLLFGAWALIGWDGMSNYPALLSEVQDVYSIRSLSLATLAGGLGAPVDTAVAACWLAGVALLGLAAWHGRDGDGDGDRRVFGLAVAACILASPIVWPNYAALLFVPIAITWPRLAPAWCFGYAIWLAGAAAPDPAVRDAGPPPYGVPEQAWLWSHTEPRVWFAAGVSVTALTVTLLVVAPNNVRKRSPGRPQDAGTVDGSVL